VLYILKVDKLDGNISYKGYVNDRLIITANGILLLVLLDNSLILTFINIKINRNKIDTAPTYTSR
jgi:SepF-like predicted cell division protein (DUF552 family)